MAFAVNGYWGQALSTDYSLRNFCDTGIKYASISFINLSPEHDPSGSGFPGLNVGPYCGAAVYNGNSKLLSDCQSLKTDIPYCQSKGVKVLLSIGGVWDSTNNNYAVSTEEKGIEFADFLYKAFGPCRDSCDGPRPFDPSSSEHVAIDGYDFDLEIPQVFDNSPYIAMANRLKSLDPSIFLSAAPQCPTSDQYFHMKELIQKAPLDALFIQFYNNPGCQYDSAGFNLREWGGIISASDKSKQAKVFVGLPSATTAAGSGYISPEQISELICQYKDLNNFGGISLWDLHRSVNIMSNGQTFLQQVLDSTNSGCGAALPTTPSTTSGQETEKRSSSPAPGSPAPETPAPGPNTESPAPNPAPESPAPNPAPESPAPNPAPEGPASNPVPEVPASSPAPGSPASGPAPGSPVPSMPAEPMTTDSATVERSMSTVPASWSNSTMSSRTQEPMMTKTIFGVEIETATECPPNVVKCPARGVPVTKTVALYTTVCPASLTDLPESIVINSTPAPAPVPSPAPSTASNTGLDNVNTCPPGVVGCNVGEPMAKEVKPPSSVEAPSPMVQEAPVPDCSGPDCADASMRPAANAPMRPAANAPTKPTPDAAIKAVIDAPTSTVADAPAKPAADCEGPNCRSGVAKPSVRPGRISPGASTVPSTVSGSPFVAGASTLAMGLTGLMAIFAVQVVVL
ncbi:hypothetical protein RJ55_01770 [Drechmeria coniospora]|nr:hypothetical protein RJ55_01770 [Drechmeria coniospora]